jgi:hypothetical protein
MKLTLLYYAPTFGIQFTLREVELLRKAAESHYDPRCKETTDKLYPVGEFGVTCYLSSTDMDFIQKSLEFPGRFSKEDYAELEQIAVRIHRLDTLGRRHTPKSITEDPEWEYAKCTLCCPGGNEETAPGFAHACLVNDVEGYTNDQGWSCDGECNLSRPKR